MRFMASKSILAAIVITAGGLVTHTAKAETSVKVPFSFTVSGQTMPAGLYTIQEDTYHNLVTLKSHDSTRSFSAVLKPGDPSPNEVHVALKFEQSGNAHILKSIQYGSKVTSPLDKGARESGFDPARLSQGR